MLDCRPDQSPLRILSQKLSADPSRVVLRPFHLAWQASVSEPSRAAQLVDEPSSLRGGQELAVGRQRGAQPARGDADGVDRVRLTRAGIGVGRPELVDLAPQQHPRERGRARGHGDRHGTIMGT